MTLHDQDHDREPDYEPDHDKEDRQMVGELHLLDLLDIATRATDISREMFTQISPGKLTRKTDRDFATELDYAIERELRTFLQDRTPDVGFLGEEEGGHNLDWGTYWALDPVDGTANLIHGLPLCGTSLGLIHNGQPIAGVIDLPWLDERFTAADGHGAHLNGQSIRANQTTDLGNAIVSLGDFAVGPNAARRNQRRFEVLQALVPVVERVRMLGSAAIDLAWVATGRLDASIMLANKPWDVAAGVTIAREAGAKVLDLDGSEHSAKATATVSSAQPLAAAIADRLSDLVS